MVLFLPHVRPSLLLKQQGLLEVEAKTGPWNQIARNQIENKSRNVNPELAGEPEVPFNGRALP